MRMNAKINHLYVKSPKNKTEIDLNTYLGMLTFSLRSMYLVHNTGTQYNSQDDFFYISCEWLTSRKIGNFFYKAKALFRQQQKSVKDEIAFTRNSWEKVI